MIRKILKFNEILELDYLLGFLWKIFISKLSLILKSLAPIQNFPDPNFASVFLVSRYDGEFWNNSYLVKAVNDSSKLFILDVFGVPGFASDVKYMAKNTKTQVNVAKIPFSKTATEKPRSKYTSKNSSYFLLLSMKMSKKPNTTWWKMLKR